ncbi:unnamed protein product, partial [Musa textilis]
GSCTISSHPQVAVAQVVAACVSTTAPRRQSRAGRPCAGTITPTTASRRQWPHAR